MKKRDGKTSILKGESRDSAAQRLVDGILASCRDGGLQAGDRLASIRDLGRIYQVGQATVDLALSRLVDDGLVVRKPRSGCYLTDKVAGLREPGAAGASEGEASAESGANGLTVMDFMVPRSRNRLTLYITDTEAVSMALWQALADEFSADHGLGDPRLLSCRDGHLEELLTSESIDVVETTALIMQALGNEVFKPLPEGLLADEWPRSLVWPVREWLTERGSPWALPFEVTTGYLFVNQHLAVLADLPDLSGLDAAVWLRHMREAQARLKAHDADADAFAFSSLYDLLTMGGALGCGAQEQVVYCETRARAILEELTGAGYRFHGRDEHLAFNAGKLMCIYHASFNIVNCKHVDFPWHAIPLPVTPGVRMPGWLMQLAVCADTREPIAAFEFIRFLLSPTVQARFAELHANVPVDAAAAASMGDEHVSGEEVMDALNRTSLVWPERLRYRLQQDLAMMDDIQALAAGTVSSEKLLAHIRFRLNLLSKDVTYLAADAASVVAESGREGKRRPVGKK